MIKFTIIGGSGFIGTRICRELDSRGESFEIVDLKPSRSFPEHSKIVDIRDLAALSAAVTGEMILHLAATHRDDIRDLSEYQTTNVDGTANVCLVASEKGIRRIVFTSSVAVYGFAQANTGEDGTISPFNEYGRTKYDAEKVLMRWFADDKTQRECIIVRPTVVFGEGNRGNVYNLLNQIAAGRFVMIGDGRNFKSMAYVGNLAEFLILAAEVPERHGVFNYVDEPDFDMNTLVSTVRGQILGRTGVGPRLPYLAGITLGYLADLVAGATGRRMPVSSIRVRKFCSTTTFSSTKQNLAGFEPPYTLKEALRRTLEAEFISPDPDREIFFTE